jgi:hypothetical protein
LDTRDKSNLGAAAHDLASTHIRAETQELLICRFGNPPQVVELSKSVSLIEQSAYQRSSLFWLGAMKLDRGVTPQQELPDEAQTHPRHGIGRVRVLLERMAFEVPG